MAASLWLVLRACRSWRCVLRSPRRCEELEFQAVSDQRRYLPQLMRASTWCFVTNTMFRRSPKKAFTSTTRSDAVSQPPSPLPEGSEADFCALHPQPPTPLTSAGGGGGEGSSKPNSEAPHRPDTLLPVRQPCVNSQQLPSANFVPPQQWPSHERGSLNHSTLPTSTSRLHECGGSVRRGQRDPG